VFISVKNLSSTFLTHVRSGQTSLAFCWRLTLRDGRVLGFTAHDQPLLIEGITYEPENGIAPSAYQQDLSLEPDDVELKGLFSTTQISERDLIGGRLDSAEYQYFLVNWQALPTSLSASPADFLLLSAGRLGEYKSTERDFTASGLSLIDRLAEKQPIQTSPVCRATLGDSKCTVNLAPFTFNLLVSSVTGNRTIVTNVIALPDGYFKNGKLEFLTGENAGTKIKIADWVDATNTLTLFLPTFYDIAPGDSIRCIAGCDKRLATCRDKFNNVLNFRGEPSIPGQDVWTSGVPVEGLDPDEE
jgi:uncharacterized phage protein (TIGR02218 family)